MIHLYVNKTVSTLNLRWRLFYLFLKLFQFYYKFKFKNQYHLLIQSSDDTDSPVPNILTNTLDSLGFSIVSEMDDYNPDDWESNAYSLYSTCNNTKEAISKIKKICNKIMKIK